jgi:D-alanyl-D-alanine dipeptidase
MMVLMALFTLLTCVCLVYRSSGVALAQYSSSTPQQAQQAVFGAPPQQQVVKTGCAEYTQHLTFHLCLTTQQQQGLAA